MSELRKFSAALSGHGGYQRVYLCSDVDATILELRAQVEEAQRHLANYRKWQDSLVSQSNDAERYRWLRDTGAAFTVRASGGDGSECTVIDINRPALGLDAAIDAALKGAGGGK